MRLRPGTTIALLVAAACSGCGTASSVHYAVAPVERVRFGFSDERPPEMRHSRVDAGPEGGIVVYSDDNLSPAPAEIVQAVLQAKLGDVLAGRHVALTGFALYVAEPGVGVDTSRLVTPAGGSPAGAALAAPVILGIESVRSQKQVNVEIRGRIDQTEFTSWTYDRFRGRVTEADLQSTLDEAMAQLVRDVQAALARAPAPATGSAAHS